MKKKLLTKVFAAALAVCMTIPMLAQGASAANDRTYLKMSITDGETRIEDTSSSYLTEESPLLVEIAQIISNNEDTMARKFRSRAMHKLMDEGLRARKNQDRWNSYLEKMSKNLTDPDGMMALIKDVDCSLGDLKLGHEYQISYRNDAKGDCGYKSVYTVTLSTHLVANAHFEDVSGDYWAADAIAFVANRGLFNGTSANLFSPEIPMTRQMLMTVLARLDGADTSETPYAKGMAWALAKGISDGSNPTHRITRQQLAAMLYRYIGKPAVTGSLEGFPDDSQVAEYAQQAMIWATTNGIVAGKTDGRLDPCGLATRAQVAMMLSRFCALEP